MGKPTSKKGPKALMIRLTEELRNKVSQRAQEQERPMNFVVLKIIEAHFAAENRP